LTKALQPNNVKYMSRFIFAALGWLCINSAAHAQQAPGRDLFEFPLGLLGEAAALSSQMAGGLWNPASAALAAPRRAAFGFAGLTTPQEQGVQLNLVAAAYNVRPRLTASLSLASASVNDVLRTDTDPQSLGGEIPYNSTILSLGAAASRANTVFGLTARYRWGTSDEEHTGVLGVDAGLVVDRIAHSPVRVALSTFLFSPARRASDATYLAAADVPLFSRDSTLRLRAGVSVSHTEGRGHGEYTFGTLRYRQIDISAGLSETFDYGNLSRGWRLGCGLNYAGYTVAIGREDGAAGLGASYQFVFKRVLP
jgi:hypothetical protein